jgi:hypothetical protein
MRAEGDDMFVGTDMCLLSPDFTKEKYNKPSRDSNTMRLEFKSRVLLTYQPAGKNGWRWKQSYDDEKNNGLKVFIIITIIIIIFILTANGVLHGGSGTTIRRNTQISHKITPRSNETQHTKLHTQ